MSEYDDENSNKVAPYTGDPDNPLGAGHPTGNFNRNKVSDRATKTFEDEDYNPVLELIKDARRFKLESINAASSVDRRTAAKNKIAVDKALLPYYAVSAERVAHAGYEDYSEMGPNTVVIIESTTNEQRFGGNTLDAKYDEVKDEDNSDDDLLVDDDRNDYDDDDNTE